MHKAGIGPTVSICFTNAKPPGPMFKCCNVYNINASESLISPGDIEAIEV